MAIPNKLLNLAAGRGPRSVTLTRKEVFADGEAGRQELAAFMAAHPELDYAYDLWGRNGTGLWTISRHGGADLFGGRRR